MSTVSLVSTPSRTEVGLPNIDDRLPAPAARGADTDPPLCTPLCKCAWALVGVGESSRVRRTSHSLAWAENIPRHADKKGTT